MLSMHLCGLHYVFEHIAGEDNVWADLSRDTPVKLSESLLCKHAVVLPLHKRQDREAQHATGREHSRLRVALKEEDGVMTIEGRPWIPNGTKEPLVRLFAVAHTGPDKHCAARALSSELVIHRTKETTASPKAICFSLRHNKSSPTGRHHPLDCAFTRKNGKIYSRMSAAEGSMYFSAPVRGHGDNTYLLVAEDELTRYCELVPYATPTAFVAAEGLSMWYSRFGDPEMLISDQRTHFKNGTVEYLNANGTNERLNMYVLQVVKVLLLEFDITITEWLYHHPALQASLNHTSLRLLGGHSPIELSTGLPASTRLGILDDGGGADNLQTIGMNAVSVKSEELRDALYGMHEEVLDEKERRRVQDMAAHKGCVVYFDVGHFSRVDHHLPDNKLKTQWIGPFKVTEMRPHSFLIQHFVTGREYDVHSSRLKFDTDP
ncbi:LOW QUALITY PROTEIN: hypothetical protein PHMEG_00031832 [Phytophthora megakarya]|uniref:Integrase catalytic domain-containing protein n=1 Tax=Phytophthora megakarya TaxID=4795 RepID=A0A225UWS6_9STRA|nr:LOW QUALITY PROTEIN: hypothetical protein PHMEG_00031832 [Phytophthora megakarya]